MTEDNSAAPFHKKDLTGNEPLLGQGYYKVIRCSICGKVIRFVHEEENIVWKYCQACVSKASSKSTHTSEAGLRNIRYWLW